MAKTLHLVYQHRLANIVEQDEKGTFTTRWRGTFKECEALALGAYWAGGEVLVWHWDEPGAVEFYALRWEHGIGPLYNLSKRGHPQNWADHYDAHPSEPEPFPA